MKILDIVIVLILVFFAKIVCNSVAGNIVSPYQISLSIFRSFFLGVCIGKLICIGAYLRRCQSTIDRTGIICIKPEKFQTYCRGYIPTYVKPDLKR